MNILRLDRLNHLGASSHTGRGKAGIWLQICLIPNAKLFTTIPWCPSYYYSIYLFLFKSITEYQLSTYYVRLYARHILNSNFNVKKTYKSKIFTMFLWRIVVRVKTTWKCQYQKKNDYAIKMNNIISSNKKTFFYLSVKTLLKTPQFSDYPNKVRAAQWFWP